MSRRGELFDRVASDPDIRAVDLVDPVGEAELREDDFGPVERVGLDRVAADFEKAFVKLVNPIRPRETDMIAIIDLMRAAPIGIGGIEAVNIRSHRPVQNQDAFSKLAKKIGGHGNRISQEERTLFR